MSVCVCVCVCVCLCKILFPANNFQIKYPIYTKFYPYIQYHTGTLQQNKSHYLILEIVSAENFLIQFFLNLINMGKFWNLYHDSDIWFTDRCLKFSI